MKMRKMSDGGGGGQGGCEHVIEVIVIMQGHTDVGLTYIL